MAADQEEGVVEACFIARSAPMGFADAPFDLMLACKIDFLRRITMVCHCPKKSCRYFVIQRDVVWSESALFRDVPLPSSYGFVVKNERGDSIYVACVFFFFEPLTQSKVNQLNQLSERRRRTSLPHCRFCERHEKRPLRRRRQTRDGVLQRFDRSFEFARCGTAGGFTYCASCLPFSRTVFIKLCLIL